MSQVLPLTTALSRVTLQYSASVCAETRTSLHANPYSFVYPSFGFLRCAEVSEAGELGRQDRVRDHNSGHFC